MISKLVKAGTKFAADEGAAKRIRLANSIALILATSAMPFWLIFAIKGNWRECFLNIVFSLAYAPVVVLNAWGRARLAAWWLLVLANFSVFLVAVMWGKAIGPQLLFFALFCVPLMLFDLKSRFSLIFSMFTAVVCYEGIEIYGDRLTRQMNSGFIATGNTVTESIVVFLILGAIVYYFKRTNERSEADLKVLVTELRGALKKISEQQQLIVQSSKMSALGVMAGGVAHEINTPLAVIDLRASHMELLLKKTEGMPEDFKISLDAIRVTVDRIAKIISGLQAFAREGTLVGSPGTELEFAL